MSTNTIVLNYAPISALIGLLVFLHCSSFAKRMSRFRRVGYFAVAAGFVLLVVLGPKP